MALTPRPLTGRERQKRFRDKQKALRQDSGTHAVLQAAAAAPGGFDAASALQHAHSLAAYGIADPTALAQAIFASHAGLPFGCAACLLHLLAAERVALNICGRYFAAWRSQPALVPRCA